MQTPKVGQTRCYWSLLSADLLFVYLDPVLASHLEDQRDLLIGKPLLEFVHPDEVENAKADLGDMLSSRTLHGTVTRVRFTRLSRVRRILGHQGPAPTWGDADKIAVDENYMVVDIVINYAADGVILCFLHATVDLAPQDNDPTKRSDWTNWCGTPWMTQEEIQVLLSRLALYAPNSSSSPLDRVFQILQNAPGRPLLMSWPPDPPHVSSLTSKHFASLSVNVNMGDENNSADAKTSCTRRYKSFQYIDFLNRKPQVESIFIPHGSIIFACHKLEQSDSALNSTLTRPSQLHPMGYDAATTMSPSTPSYYHPHQQHAHSYSLPPLNSGPHQYAYMPPHQAASQYKYDTYAGRYDSYPASGGSGVSGQQQWSSTNRTGGYWNQQHAQQQYGSDTAATPSHDPYYSSQLSSYSSTLSLPDRDTPDNEIAALVPPPRRRGVDQSYEFPPSVNGQDTPRGSEVKEGRSARSRNSASRPNDVLRCSSCKATSSPEWRKGPSGKKELCNACGLRYARSKAKKEGTVNNHHTSTSHPYHPTGRKRKGAVTNGPTPSIKTSPSLRSISGTPSPSSATTSLNSSLSSLGYPPSPNQHYNGTPPPQNSNGTGVAMIGMGGSGSRTAIHQPLHALHIQPPFSLPGGIRRGFVGPYDSSSSADYPRNGSASPAPHSASGYHNKMTYPPSIPSPLSGVQASTTDHRPPQSLERNLPDGPDEGEGKDGDDDEFVPEDEEDDEYIDTSERRRKSDTKYRRSAQRGKSDPGADDHYRDSQKVGEHESALRLSSQRSVMA